MNEKFELSTVENLLSEAKLEKLKEICCNEDNRLKVIESSMEIFKSVFTHFLEHKTSDEDRDVIKHLYSYLAEVANAKDMVYAVLEYLDPSSDLDAFDLLMPCLTIICRKTLKTDIKHIRNTIGMSLSSITYYGESINMPNYESAPSSQPNSDESKLYRFMDTAVSLASTILKDLLDQKADEARDFSGVIREFFAFGAELLCLLVNLDMDKLLYVEVDRSSRNRAPSYNQPYKENFDLTILKDGDSCGERVVDILLQTHSACHLLNDTSWSSLVDWSDADEHAVKRLQSRGCLFYLLIVCKLKCKRFPKIFTSKYIFCRCLPSISSMVKSQHTPCIYKALKLCHSLVDGIEPVSLVLSDFKKNEIKEMLSVLSKVAYDNPSTSVRSDSIRLIAVLLERFQWLDRFILLKDLLLQSEHAGIISYLTVYLKDKIQQVLRQNSPTSSSPAYQHFLRHVGMMEILDFIYELPGGHECDILVHYPRITASLSLLTILVKLDVNDETNILQRVSSIEKNYLSPLINGLNLSKMQMDEEIRKARSESLEEQQTQMEINGSSLISLPVEERVQILQGTICQFEMMQFNCVTVQQHIDDRTTKKNRRVHRSSCVQ